MNLKKALRLPVFVAFFLAVGAAPTVATPAEEGPVSWPPPDTGGKYLPVPDDYYAPIEFEACGTTVTMEAGAVRDVHYKSRVKQNGSTVLKFKGDATVDLTRASDGAFIDELDISGTAYQYISADELTLVDLLGGRSIVAAASPEEAELMAEEGLPEFAYYTRGWLGFYSQFSEDPKVMEPIASDIVLNTTRHVHDVCEMLDEAAWE